MTRTTPAGVPLDALCVTGRPGDVIQKVNNRRVWSVESLNAAMALSGAGPAIVAVSREGRSVFLIIDGPRA